MAKLSLGRDDPVPPHRDVAELILIDTCYVPRARHIFESIDRLMVNPVHRADKLSKLLLLLPNLRCITISTGHIFTKPLRIVGVAKELVFTEKSTCTLVGHITKLTAPQGGMYTICGRVDQVDAPLATVVMVETIPDDAYQG